MLPTKFQWAFNRTIRNLDIWGKFQEVFVMKTGRAKLRCIHCHELLTHPLLSITDPNALGTATTTTLARHLKRCNKALKASQSGSESINPTTIKELQKRRPTSPSLREMYLKRLSNISYLRITLSTLRTIPSFVS